MVVMVVVLSDLTPSEAGVEGDDGFNDGLFIPASEVIGEEEVLFFVVDILDSEIMSMGGVVLRWRIDAILMRLSFVFSFLKTVRLVCVCS